MDVSSFRKSLSGSAPPAGVDGRLAALWHAAKGEWDKAHALVQDDPSREAAWVHAHLHRVEGDQSNADYWYGRAGKKLAAGPIETEWDEIAAAMLVHFA